MWFAWLLKNGVALMLVKSGWALNGTIKKN